MRLKKNNVYIVRMNEQVKEILEDLRILGKDFMYNHQISLDLVKKVLQAVVYARCVFSGRICQQPGNFFIPFGNLVVI